jgi:4-hydroxybenzoate polyprenyltransferase/phosphoserine phosphatase
MSGDVEADVPLVIDLDDTLVRTDLLVESFFGVLGRNPLAALKALPALAKGKEALKARLAQQFVFDPATLPYNPAVIALAQDAAAKGRRVVLASASDARIVGAIADHLGFDQWFASDGTTNLKSSRKAARLVSEFGERNFDYAGNEAADLKVWRHARNAIAVGAPDRIVRRLRMGQEVTRIDSAQPSFRPWIKMIRPHQWAKNALVLVPMLTSHQFSVHNILVGVLAFVAFSLCASGGYVVNDLVDIEADRAHPTKKKRPFAGGDVPVLKGAMAGALILTAAFALAAAVNLNFLAALAVYFGVNMAYSFSLKRKMIIDVVTLGGLYTIRVVAGAEAIGVELSEWLMAFSMFMFLFLAIIKRHSEMVMRLNAGLSDPSNRNYKAVDINVLAGLAAAAGYSSVIVFALYIASDTARSLYSHVQYLWFACPLLLYWIARFVMMSQRQHIPDDPLVFALRDRVTLGLAVAVLALGAAAL